MNRQSSSTPRARNARDWYVFVFGHEPNALIGEELAGIDVAHPPECIEAVFRDVAALNTPTAFNVRSRFKCGIDGPHYHDRREAEDERRRTSRHVASGRTAAPLQRRGKWSR